MLASAVALAISSAQGNESIPQINTKNKKRWFCLWKEKH
jgi:hypothetical protein